MVRVDRSLMEDLKAEVEHTKRALLEADTDRKEILRLLQAFAASPRDLLEVVEEYLQRRGKSSVRDFKYTSMS